MSKHKTTSKNLLEKIDANNVLVNKWAVLGVDANAIDSTLCCKPVPINHSLEQVNQHVWDKTQTFFSDAKFSSSQCRFFKSASNVKLAKQVHIQVTQAKRLWAFKLAEQDWSFRSCDGIDRLFLCMFQKWDISKIPYWVYKDVLCCLSWSWSCSFRGDINASAGCISPLLLNDNCSSEETMSLFNSILQWRVGWSLYKIH